MKILPRSSLILWVLMILALGLLAVSLLAPWLVPHDPNVSNAAVINQPPSFLYPFGTDRLGRCVFSRVLDGAGISIFSALALVSITLMLGTGVGMLSGYLGGAVDTALMRMVDVVLSFPQMILAIAVAGIWGGGLWSAMLAMGLSGWTLYARLARSRVLQIKNEAYVLEARLSGCPVPLLLLRYLLPGVSGTVFAAATTQLGSTMVGLAGLSFLGFGVTPPQAEWGSMISESRAYIQLSPWCVLGPAGAIVLSVLVFNLLGEAVKERMEEKPYGHSVLSD